MCVKIYLVTRVQVFMAYYENVVNVIFCFEYHENKCAHSRRITYFNGYEGRLKRQTTWILLSYVLSSKKKAFDRLVHVYSVFLAQ